MSRVFTRLHVHLVWAVRDRQPVLDPDAWARLAPTLAQKARALGCGYVVVGGVADHVHVLLELPTTRTVADLAGRLKGVSTHLAAVRGLPLRWQQGYGAFAVSRRDLPAVEQYVRGQPTRHACGDVLAGAELDGRAR